MIGASTTLAIVTVDVVESPAKSEAIKTTENSMMTRSAFLIFDLFSIRIHLRDNLVNNII